MDPVVLRIEAEVNDALEKTNQLREQYEKFAATYTRAMGDMARVANTFSGDKVTRQAQMMTAALGGVENVTKLTRAEQDKYNKVLTEASEKSKALGREIPAEWQKILQATQRLSPELRRLTDGFSGARVKREAQLYIQALGGIQNVSRLTQAEQRRMNAVLTEAAAKYRALGQQVPRDMQQILAATQQATTGGNTLFRQFFSGVAGGVSVGYVLGRAFIGVFHGIQRAISKTIEMTGQLFAALVKRGTEVDRIQSSFIRLAGTLAPGILEAGRKSVRGLASDFDLMVAANRAVLLGLPVTAKTFGDLASASLLLGRAMGLDAARALSDLTIALGRISPRILDNLGIIVKVRDANVEYARTIGKNVQALTAEERQIAFYLKAVEAMRLKVEQLGDVQLNLGERLQVVRAGFQNYIDAVSVATVKSPALNYAVGELAQGLFKAFGKNSSAQVLLFVKTIDWLAIRIVHLAEWVLRLAAQWSASYFAMGVIFNEFMVRFTRGMAEFVELQLTSVSVLAQMPGALGAPFKLAEAGLIGVSATLRKKVSEFQAYSKLAAKGLTDISGPLQLAANKLADVREAMEEFAKQGITENDIQQGFLDLAKGVEDSVQGLSQAEIKAREKAEKEREKQRKKELAALEKFNKELLKKINDPKQFDYSGKIPSSVTTMTENQGLLKWINAQNPVLWAKMMDPGQVDWSGYLPSSVTNTPENKSLQRGLEQAPPGYRPPRRERERYYPSIIKDFQNARGMDKFAVGFQGAMGLYNGISDVWSATQQSGSVAGNALGGMQAGAQAGAMFGPWGMAVGAAAGLVTGLIRGKPAWAKAADEVGRDFGVKISEGLAKEIEADAKELFKGDTSTANIYNLSKVIQEAGGVTTGTLDQWSKKLKDVYSFVERGQLTTAQGAEVVNEVFGQLTAVATKNGGLITKELLEIIKLNKQFKMDSEAIQEFFSQQLEKGASAVGSIVGGMTASLEKELEDFTEGLPSKVKDDAEALTEATEGYAKRIGGSYQTEFDRISRLSLATFSAMLASGKTAIEAITALGEPIDNLIASAEKFGLAGNDAFNQLSRWRTLTTDNAALIASLGGVNDLMAVLYNTGSLTSDIYKDLQAQGAGTFAQLTAAGFSQNEALTMMKPLLENIVRLHKERGWAIDEETQKLITMADEQGILSATQMSTNDVLMTGFGAIIDALGGELPDAFKKFRDRSVENLNDVALGFAGVDREIGYLHDQLYGGDYTSWGKRLADAAREAGDEISNLNFGTSPGGLKEIPIQLAHAMTQASAFSRTMVSEVERASRAVNLAFNNGELLNLNGTANLAVNATASSTDGVQGAERVERMMAQLVQVLASGILGQTRVEVNAQTIDGTDLDQLVLDKIMPRIKSVLEFNLGEYLTTFKQLLG